MREDAEGRGRGRASRWRIVGWSVAGLGLLLPLAAMQVTDEVNWGAGDFAVAGALVLGVGVTYELAARATGNGAYRAAVAVALAAAFILVWISLAVGVIGSEGDPANLMYGGVLAVGIVGAVLARGRPRGMARALLATALAAGAGRRDRADRRPGRDAAARRGLRRAVAGFGLAVPEGGAGGGGGGLEQPAPRQLRPQRRDRGEADRVEADGGRGGDVRRAVVDEDASPGLEAVAGEAAAEDLGVGLDHAFVAGDHDVAEAGAEEREARDALGPLGAGEVGDGVEGDAAGGELGEERLGALDRAFHALVPAGVEGGDQLGAVRVPGAERRDAFVPVGAAVELEVPVHEADLGEEGLDRRFVGQEPAVDEPRVPADQHVADVEDHRVARPLVAGRCLHGHRTWASFLRRGGP